MKKTLSNTVPFILLYILFLIPTYILPYMGSNSTLIGNPFEGVNYGFWIHLTCLIILVYLAKIRTSRLTKGYLYAFPLVALIFDMVPVLSIIPLIPTVMHVLAITLGITQAKDEVVTTI